MILGLTSIVAMDVAAIPAVCRDNLTMIVEQLVKLVQELQEAEAENDDEDDPDNAVPEDSDDEVCARTCVGAHTHVISHHPINQVTLPYP